MARPFKIDIAEMFRLRKGEDLVDREPDKHGNRRTMAEVAKILGVSTPAICRAEKKLTIAIQKDQALETGHRVMEKKLDVAQQVIDSNRRIGEISDDLMKKLYKKRDSKTLDVVGRKDIREIIREYEEERRKQLAFQMEIFKALTDYKVVVEFQKAVLETVGNANKSLCCDGEIVCARCRERVNLREEIIKKLKAGKALRESVVI